MTQSKIARSRPRNPFVALARFRRAGAHAPAERRPDRKDERRFYIRDLAGFELLPCEDDADDKSE
jgi:hypothetical protein